MRVEPKLDQIEKLDLDVKLNLFQYRCKSEYLSNEILFNNPLLF